MSVLRRLARNIATNWVVLALNIVLSFFLAPFVVNTLGSVYYGVWALTMQFTGYLYLLDFGVRDAVLRYASKYRAMNAGFRLNQIIRVAHEIYFPISAAVVVLSVVGAWVFPFVFSIDEVPTSEAQLVVLIVGLTIAQTFLLNIFLGVLHGFHRFDVGNYIAMSFSLVRAGLVVLALKAGYGIVGLSIAQLAVSVAGGATGFVVVLLIMRNEGFRFTWVPLTRKHRSVLFRRMIGYSAFVFLNNLGQKTSAAAGPLIIGVFLPVAAVTPYAIAGSLVGYVRALVVSSSWVFNPVVSHYSALKDLSTLTDIVQRGTRFAIVLALPAIVSFILIGDVFIGLWMGSEFVLQAAAVLLVLAIAELVSAPHHVMTAALYGMNKHQALAAMRILEAVSNVILSILLVRVWGVIGVAIGAAIPHVLLVCIAVPLLLQRHISVSFGQLMGGIFVRPLMGVVPFAAAMQLTYALREPRTLVEFFSMIALLLPVYGVSVFYVSIERRERDLALDKVRSFLRRHAGDVRSASIDR